MGKRSRKRMLSGDVPAPAGGPTRAQRDEARRQRAEAAKAGGAATRRRSARGDLPPAPWGKFPLSELTILISIILIVAGFIVSGERGLAMFAAGLALGTLGGLEVSIREHFAGYRSHSLLLAGFMAVLTITAVTLSLGKVFVPILLGAALAVFASTFMLFREAFRRRSGGVSFR